MTQTASSLLITAVAVLGTLVSALLAQRQANRSMDENLNRLDRHHTIEAHRAGYTALNTAARRYLTALTNHLHALRLGNDAEMTTADLQRARAAHADCYAEVQLIAPDPVLTTARTVNRTLNHVFGMLMRLTQDTCLAGDSLDTAQAHITELWDGGLADLRERMRLDLGITDTPAPLVHSPG